MKELMFLMGIAVAAGAAVAGYLVGKDYGRRQAIRELDDDWLDDNVEFDDTENMDSGYVSPMNEAEDCSAENGFTPCPEDETVTDEATANLEDTVYPSASSETNESDNSASAETGKCKKCRKH